MEKIISADSTPSQRDEFRKKKVELLEKGYPLQETFEFISQNYQKVKKSVLKQISVPAVLFLAPSSSQRNIIPRLFAEMIKKDIGKCEILNKDNFYARCSHLLQAKNRFNLNERINETIDFKLSNIDSLKEQSKNRSVYIIDDVCSTGETAINLKKRLEQEGINVSGVVALVTSDKYLFRQSDKQRLMESFGKIAQDETARKFIETDIDTYLDGYPRNKATRLERMIKRDNPQSIEEALVVLSKGAKVYREIGLDGQNPPAPENIINKSINKDKGLSL